MTAEDVKNVTFEKVMRGYRVEDVDDFLMQVAAELEKLQAALASKEAEKVQMKDNTEGKMYVLAQKVEEYRGMEETLKTALINAQRMGETVVKEAKQKADSLIREATGKSELLRQQAEQETLKERMVLEKLQAEVTRFKSTVLNMYKQHIESLSALDVPTEEAAEYLKSFPPYMADEQQPEIPQADALPEENVEMGEATPQVPDNKEEAVKAAGIDTQPPETISSVNLFEGVPLDNNMNE